MQPLLPRTIRRTAAAFALLAAAALAGFWAPYLSRLSAQPTHWMHWHAAGVAGWLVLLIVQPMLMATGRAALHRRLGQAAWVLLPYVTVSSFVLAVVMTRPRPGAPIEEFRYALFFVQVATTALFAACVALALAFRRHRALHARLMLASGLTFIDPVFARVFAHFTPGSPWLVNHGSIVLSLLAIGALAWADRRAAQGRWIFATFFGLNLVMQALALRIDQWPAWRAAMLAWLS